MTSNNKQINDFLVTENNLKYAIELSDEVDRFKKEMHILFWNKYNELMSLKMANSNLYPRWKYRSFNLKKLLTAWNRSSLIQSELPENKLQLIFYFLQESRETNFRLSYSVAWNKKSVEVKHDSPTMLLLRAKLLEYKINIAGEWEYLWGHSNWRIFDGPFLVRLYKESEQFCQEIVDQNWEMFLELRPLFEEVAKETGDK